MNEWMEGGEGVPLSYVHQNCGKPTQASITCSECGEALRPQEVETQIGPALEGLAAQMENEGLRDFDFQTLLSHSNAPKR